MEENLYQFRQGQFFETYESVNQYFHKFCELNYHPFIVRSHSKNQIVYRCCHGIERKSKCSGLRPNQHYFFKGCTAKINLYKNKQNKWKVTTVSLDHNHSISKGEYSLYRKNGKLKADTAKSATDLKVENSKGSDVAEILEKKFEGRLTQNPVDCGSNVTKNKKKLTDEEKFNMSFNVIINLVDALKQQDTPLFLNYMQELKIMENNIRKGLPLFNNAQPQKEPNPSNMQVTQNVDTSHKKNFLPGQIKKEVDDAWLPDTSKTSSLN